MTEALVLLYMMVNAFARGFPASGSLKHRRLKRMRPGNCIYR